MGDVIRELEHLEKLACASVTSAMAMRESWMQRQVARPVWRELGGNVHQR
jgi:hypothetical protein